MNCGSFHEAILNVLKWKVILTQSWKDITILLSWDNMLLTFTLAMELHLLVLDKDLSMQQVKTPGGHRWTIENKQFGRNPQMITP
jgi:hypothetical protein